MDAVKTEYPYLIESPAEAPVENSDLPPETPDVLDKENFLMTEILPHIFVGMYLFQIKLRKRNRIE